MNSSEKRALTGQADSRRETDMQEREDQYSKLSDKYLEDAEALLQVGDYVQASEKFWDAAALTVKTVAAGMGMEVNSRREMWSFVSLLRNERDEPELNRLFSAASNLHQNVYEDWLPPDTVTDYGEAVKEFVSRLGKAVG